MIIERQKSTIETSGNFVSSRSKIVADVNMKKILRSGIYTDKMLAVIRETISNAADSHVQAGCPDKPVHIQLPNNIDPVFKVRDFGVGLDDYGVREILFSYGDPTNGGNVKGQSNDYHGMFHIGAKAPWSYSNTFQVTAIKDGIKRVYLAYIDETEDDCISQVGSEEFVDEENGVEISVTIKQEDIYKFCSKVYEFLKFWNPYPIITGNDNFGKIEPKWLIKNDQWGFQEKPYNGYYGSLQSYIVMAGVPYKINSGHLDNISDTNTKLLNNGLVIFCNIGDVKLATSREEVEYTDKTKNFIKLNLDLVEKEITASVNEKLAELKTEYEARQLYYELYHGAISSVNFKLVYNNGFYFNSKLINNADIQLYSARAYFKKSYYNNNHITSRITLHIDVNILNQKTCFYTVGSSDYKKNIKKFVYNLRNTFFVKSQIPEYTLIFFNNQQEFDDFIKNTGVPLSLLQDVDTLKDVPPKPKKPRVYNKRIENCRVIGPNCSDLAQANDGSYWTNVDLTNQKGYYFSYDRFEYNSEDNFITLDFIKQAAQLLNQNIYLFSQRTSETIKKKYSNNWKNPMNLIQKNINKYLKEFQKKNISHLDEISYYSISGRIIEYLTLKQLSLPKNHVFNQYIKYINLQKNNQPKQYLSLINYFGLSFPELDDSKVKEINRKIEEEETKFGLLHYREVLINADEKDILEYLNFKDKKYKILLDSKA